MLVALMVLQAIGSPFLSEGLSLNIKGCVPILDSFVLRDSLLIIMHHMDGSLEEDGKDMFSE
jgi:hypothetical protein